MRKSLSILFLAIFVELFSFPAAKIERVGNSEFESFTTFKAHSCIAQHEWQEERSQPKRQGNSPTGKDAQDLPFILHHEKFLTELLVISLHFHPVSSSYDEAKLEVLKSRSHPPTKLLF